jgi:hypothetical protein
LCGTVIGAVAGYDMNWLKASSERLGVGEYRLLLAIILAHQKFRSG